MHIHTHNIELKLPLNREDPKGGPFYASNVSAIFEGLLHLCEKRNLPTFIEFL